MKKNQLLTAGFFLLCFIVFAFTPYGNEPWVVPDKFVKMSNPVKADVKSINAGKSLYVKNCQDCHGKKGIGDGPKASDLKTQPKDLTIASVQSQSDGAIFYKISEGRGDMPRAKKDFPDEEDRWNLVNFVRTFGHAAPKK